MNRKNRIAIIGAGQLGSRHLQGLAKVGGTAQIYVVDPSENSLNVAQGRYAEVQDQSDRNTVLFLKNLSELPLQLDLVIIATTANIRRKLIEELLQERDIRYFILEKILFQKTEDFLPIKQLFKASGVAVWVNCPRREFPIYSDIRKSLEGNKVSMSVKGKDWGLACNSIHLIDLFVFLTGENNLSFTSNELDNKIYESRRPGFKELRGAFEVETARGDQLRICDSDTNTTDFEISISTDKVKYIIDEPKRIAVRYENGLSSEVDIETPYQSQLTGKIAADILKNGKSLLTPFDECLRYHIPMLDFFNNHFSTIMGRKIEVCPIT